MILRRFHVHLCWLLGSFLVPGVLRAQHWQDTLTEIQVLERHWQDTLTDQKRQFAGSQGLQQIDARYLEQYRSLSLATLLAQQSPVFIKSYGVNSMATLSMRGASAAQSAVLWNGIPVSNPALGMADMSLLRTGLFQEVSLQYGSSAALFGSGNVGGALVLDNEAPGFYPKSNVAIQLVAGSFGRLDGGLQAEVQDKRLRVALNGFYQQAQNDMPYRDERGQKERLEHAALRGGGALLSLDYNLRRDWLAGNNERLYLKLWTQTYAREIPPALFEAASAKRQEDASLRSMLGWEKNKGRHHFYAKASYNREYLHYQDSLSLTDNRNTVQQYYQELGWKYRIGKVAAAGSGELPDEHLLLLFAPLQYAVAGGAHISSSESQLRPALAAAYRYLGLGRRLELDAALRQEWLNGGATPLLPGLGLGYHLLRNQHVGFKLMASLQRTYRIPTLNELYYFPGGNASLKPEQGWSLEGGYSLGLKRQRLELKHELHGFDRYIQDWIYWLGGAIWTPYNIAKVHSRGLETQNYLEYKRGTVKLHLGLNYLYVLSTTERSYLPGDGSMGKQIPYTPRYSLQGNVGFQWKDRLFLNYNQTYTGYRFVTVDESQYLEPYSTGNIQASYSFAPSGYRFSLGGQLQNVFNTSYQVVGGRPMPGRNFLLQLHMALYR